MMGKLIAVPIFDYGDKVTFDITLQDSRKINCIGTVEIIDRWGTFEQNDEPSYDIMVDDWDNTGTKMFCKHINQSAVRKAE